jgi:hypothetical protein
VESPSAIRRGETLGVRLMAVNNLKDGVDRFGSFRRLPFRQNVYDGEVEPSGTLQTNTPYQKCPLFLYVYDHWLFGQFVHKNWTYLSFKLDIWLEIMFTLYKVKIYFQKGCKRKDDSAGVGETGVNMDKKFVFVFFRV